MRTAVALALALVGSGLVACAVASGEVAGGEPRVDASAPPSGDRDSGSGDTFTDIYRDILGPTGFASCTASSNCHGGASEVGTQSSGYICKDKAQCRSTLISSGQLVQGEKDFTKTNLYRALRRSEKEGRMPQVPSGLIFTQAELDRIGRWVAAGAPDN